jgi:hypothetical protein
MRSHVRLVALLVLGVALGHDALGGDPAADRAARLVEARRRLEKEVAAFDAKAEAEPTTRELTQVALSKLTLGQDPRGVEELVRRALETQDMDERSPGYGAFPWRQGHPEIDDPNATEFTLQPLGPILALHKDALSEPLRRSIAHHARAAFVAMEHHEVSVDYTNIFLMRAVALILLGEQIDDDKARKRGCALLDSWLARVKEVGIHEYASPTYYSPDLESLGSGIVCVRDAETKTKLRRALDLLWTDIAASAFAPRRSLAGAHSRDYDFVHGRGGLDVSLWLEGIFEGGRAPGVSPDKALVLIAAGEDGYHPAAQIRALAATATRLVRQRWGEKPGQDRTLYVTPDFAIGSASADYGPQDRTIAVDLAGDLPVVSVLVDDEDEPFGQKKALDKSGHSKPHHLPCGLTSVQAGGTVLALLDLDPSRLHEARATLATDVTLPRGETILAGSRRVDASKPFVLALEAGAVVAVRDGNAGLAVRFFGLEACAGEKPAVELSADATSVGLHALRLVAYHHRGDARKLDEKHLQAGVLLVAAKCATDEGLQDLVNRVHGAELEAHAGKGVVLARAVVDDHRLELAHDAKTREPAWRKVDGEAVPVELFTVDGKVPPAWR